MMKSKIINFDNLCINYDSFFNHKKSGYYPYIDKKYDSNKIVIDFGDNNIIEGYSISTIISSTKFINVYKFNISNPYLLKF